MASALAGPRLRFAWLLSHSVLAAALGATSVRDACVADAAETGDVDPALIDDLQLLQSELQVQSLAAVPGEGHGVNTSQPVGRRQVFHWVEHVHFQKDAQDQRVEHVHFQKGAQDQSQVEGDAAQVTTTASPEYLGVSVNRSEDLGAFLTSIEINLLTCIAFLMAFSVLRLWFPETYQNNVILKIAPVRRIRNNYLAWYGPIQRPTTEEIAQSIGLDGAMLLEYCDMAKDMMWTIGCPMLFFTGVLNLAAGGGAAGDDYLSYISMGNVTDGNGLFYVHAVMVWFVIIVACRAMHVRHMDFLELRKAWLHGMPDRRACTMYVSNIPIDKATDSMLYKFFDDMFPNKINWARVVKDTSLLEPVVSQLREAMEKQQEALHEGEKPGGTKPTYQPSGAPTPVDAYGFWTEEVKKKQKELKNKRKLHKEKWEQTGGPREGGVNISNGFVCFKKREDAECALNLCYDSDLTRCVPSVPPCTTDINWAAAQTDHVNAERKLLVGVFMQLTLFFAFIPLVIGITNVANLITLGPLQSFWKAFAPTLGLTIMISMLPSFLIWIISYCYAIPSNDMVQLKLSQWYFWYLIFFVVLAAAIGQDIVGLVDFISTNALNPGELFTWLAETLPYSTHFFMNFMILQCASHCLNMLRLTPLLKFIFFSGIYGKKTGLKMAEPEDQEYYGKGARSARWTIFLVIGLMYGTLSPLVNWTVWLNFWVQRNLAYGWLIPFAEQRKPDTGGRFWVQMCDHTYAGLAIYYVMMNGVFLLRAGSPWPQVIATLSIFYLVHSYWHFHNRYLWEHLSMSQIMLHVDESNVEGSNVEGSNVEGYKKTLKFPHPERGEYKQPELEDEVD